MSDDARYPRSLTQRELDWLGYLLPLDRPGYATLRQAIDGLIVIAEGRWGEGDMLIGRESITPDLEEGMQPVAAYGEIAVTTPGDRHDTIILSLHQPNDDGVIEFQQTMLSGGGVVDEFLESHRWSYSYWRPGDRCPATDGPVREVTLNENADLVLALSKNKHTLWLHDATSGVNTLTPVTNFYNELMMAKTIRDPAIAFDHKRLFTAMDEFSDDDIRRAFVRYNLMFQKVARERLSPVESEVYQKKSLLDKIKGVFGGKD